MMYNNKLAIAVKANGKVLREFNRDTVYCPFGAEYTILVKNLNSVRVQFRVQVDGTDATENVWLVINPNSSMELTRFIKNGNLNQGNRFKFIERTSTVEQHRGVGVEDGLIRIEYQFERPITPLYTVQKNYYKFYEAPQWDYLLKRTTTDAPVWTTVGASSISGQAGTLTQTYSSSTAEPALNIAQNCSTTTSDSFLNDASARSMSFNDAGITVPGSVSDQSFDLISSFPVESTINVMVIKMLGETETGKPIATPVTVKVKPKCMTCGTTNKATSKFCTNCGTSLEIV